MWKVFVLGLLTGWLIKWIVDWAWRRRGLAGEGLFAEDPEVARPVVEPNEKSTTSADTPAGRVGGDVAMGAAGAVSTSSATITSSAPVYGQEDLEAVDGVDPKTGGLLRDNGITTFADLAATPVVELIRMTDRTGPSRGRAVLETWVAQARLAAAREWAGLAALQAELRGGARPGGGD